MVKPEEFFEAILEAQKKQREIDFDQAFSYWWHSIEFSDRRKLNVNELFENFKSFLDLLRKCKDHHDKFPI